MNFNEESKKISDNPMQRVTDSIKAIIDDPGVFFDIHCHVFNYEDVPDGFLGIRLPFLFKDKHFAKVEHLLHSLFRGSDTDKWSNLAYFKNIFNTKTKKEITDKLMDYYLSKKTILTPLMMDMRPGINGKQITDFETQIEQMKNLRDAYPENILPFLAVDPNNEKVQENFIKVFSGEKDYKFFGVKIYPSLGYLPAHPTLMKIFEVCQDKNIPVTAHCSGATVHASANHIKNIQGWRYTNSGELTNKPIDKFFLRKMAYADFFNHPKNWEPVLRDFPKLKLNLAHFGGGEEWEKFYQGEFSNWVSRILDMMARYDHLYTDFSYTFHTRRYNERLKQLIEENELIASRVLYGSDYYMVVQEGHFRNIKINFITIMGDKIMKQIGVINPKRFLFEKVK